MDITRPIQVYITTYAMDRAMKFVVALRDMDRADAAYKLHCAVVEIVATRPEILEADPGRVTQVHYHGHKVSVRTCDSGVVHVTSVMPKPTKRGRANA